MTNGRIKILHVYKDFHIYNSLFGSLLLLAQHTDFSKYELVLAVLDYRGSPWGKQFEKLGGRIINLRLQKGRNPLAVRQLMECFRSERPDVVQTHELKANMWGRIAAFRTGVPVVISTVWTLKDTAPSLPARVRDRLLHPLNRMLDVRSSRVIAISDAIRREWDPRLDSPHYTTIRLPLDSERTRGRKARPVSQTHEATSGPLQIGCVSRLSEEKGLEYLVRALPMIVEKVPNLRVRIAGEGPSRTALEQLADRLNVRSYLDLPGHVDNIADFLTALDVYVQPSRSESLGVAAMEAMSVGLPVVASRVGGLPEVVDDGVTGILVPWGDPRKLAEAILRLCADEDMRRRMGTAGRKTVAERFQVSTYVAKTYELYEELLSRRPSIVTADAATRAS
jgi:glycosyltransferase involved in cell wall biosynthesis